MLSIKNGNLLRVDFISVDVKNKKVKKKSKEKVKKKISDHNDYNAD